MTELITCLWFDRNAEAAAKFYAALLPDSHIDAVHTAPADYPNGGSTGDVLQVAELRRNWRDAYMPAYTVFKREGDNIHHFYSAEGNMEMADPGQDPHNAPDTNPL